MTNVFSINLILSTIKAHNYILVINKCIVLLTEKYVNSKRDTFLLQIISICEAITHNGLLIYCYIYMQQIQMAVKQADEETVVQDIAPGEVVLRERRNDLDQPTQVYNITLVHYILTVMYVFISRPHIFILY